VTKVACLGECMVELREMADGHFSRGYGGNNTAVYLARLGVAVDCSITAVQLGGAKKHLPSVGA
jgi:sugar/nucleoside kinase (ribokinase family)